MADPSTYDLLMAHLRNPRTVKWEPVRDGEIPGESSDGIGGLGGDDRNESVGDDEPITQMTQVAKLLRRIPAANRRRMLEPAYAMLNQDQVPQASRPIADAWTTGARELAWEIEECARAYAHRGRRGRYAPMNLTARERFNEFLTRWYRAVRILVPICLPKFPPTIKAFLDELPESCRERWRALLISYFRKLRGKELHQVSVREVSHVFKEVWRERGMSASDIEDLVRAMRPYGFDPDENEAEREARKAANPSPPQRPRTEPWVRRSAEMTDPRWLDGYF